MVTSSTEPMKQQSSKTSAQTPRNTSPTTGGFFVEYVANPKKTPLFILIFTFAYWCLCRGSGCSDKDCSWQAYLGSTVGLLLFNGAFFLR
ncbi:hypothetical protein QBC33DRAFT_537353 [Phialemonium atrogriseum]|uniref:Uncharacterized protein n=1 Tax=Phialemonium atrogriseum TaxID=1093897 RepID=A0AAJ0C1G2_9PEZI|nr:uncharacterized protein QBC33DRAFT_537353 [Phialemonium atrogriseum]KAK1767777.1 hypothetical protein QBC33DRAFT_537353 [Phialemonium atrogriseum]